MTKLEIVKGYRIYAGVFFASNGYHTKATVNDWIGMMGKIRG